jgi:predicted ArsR family transcriptional regulator
VANATAHPRACSRVQLTLRDLALLEDLAELRLATADQLADRHFATVRKTARNRLRRLVAGGYLARSTRYLLDRQRPTVIYALTPRAHEALERRTLYLERTSRA